MTQYPKPLYNVYIDIPLKPKRYGLTMEKVFSFTKEEEAQKFMDSAQMLDAVSGVRMNDRSWLMLHDSQSALADLQDEINKLANV